MSSFGDVPPWARGGALTAPQMQALPAVSSGIPHADAQGPAPLYRPPVYRRSRPCQACPAPVQPNVAPFTRLLVLLAYYRQPTPPANQTVNDAWLLCDQNVRFFYQHALSPVSTDVIVTAIGDSLLPPMPPPGGGVEILRMGCNPGTDLNAHAAVLRHVRDRPGGLYGYSHFAFLNCGVRGPHVRANALRTCPDSFSGWRSEVRDGPLWLAPFAHRLSGKDDVALVGPSISMQIAPHVQSHMLVTSIRHIGRAIRAWRNVAGLAHCRLTTVQRPTRGGKRARDAGAEPSGVPSELPPGVLDRVCSRRHATRDINGLPMTSRRITAPPCVRLLVPPPFRARAAVPGAVPPAGPAGGRPAARGAFMKRKEHARRPGRSLLAHAQINGTEVHISQLTLQEGAHIAALARQQQSWDVRGCTGNQHVELSQQWKGNPMSRLGIATDPLEVVFIKFGGNMLRNRNAHPRACACLRQAHELAGIGQLVRSTLPGEPVQEWQRRTDATLGRARKPPKGSAAAEARHPRFPGSTGPSSASRSQLAGAPLGGRQ